MTINLLDHFTALIGVQADDPRLLAELDALGVLRRPTLPTFFNSPYEVPFRISKHGLLLHFQDAHYINNATPRSWGKGNLQLRSVIACAGIPNEVKRFEGALPFEISWEDNREQVRAKLAAHSEWVLHEGWRDCWWRADRYISVFYQPAQIGADDAPGVFEIVQGQFYPPSKPLHRLRPEHYPAPAALIAQFGHSGHSDAFRQLLVAFKPDNWDWESTHIDLSRQYGMELYFDCQQKEMDGTPAFVGINLKRDRVGPSTAWLGALPFDLQWDNSIADVLRGIGRQPDEWDLDHEVWGWAKWRFEDHLLWIDFDTMRNRLESISLIDLNYQSFEKP